MGQFLGDGRRHIITQHQGASRPLHGGAGECRGKIAGGQIQGSALEGNHPHPRLDIRRRQRQRASGDSDAAGTQGIGNLRHQFPLLDGNIPRPARIVQVQGQFSFAALGQGAVRNLPGAVGHEFIIAPGGVVHGDGSRSHRTGNRDGSGPGIIEDEALSCGRFRRTGNPPLFPGGGIAPIQSGGPLPDPYFSGGSHHQFQGGARLLERVNQRFIPDITAPVENGVHGVKTACGANQRVFPGLRNSFQPVQGQGEGPGTERSSRRDGGADIQSQAGTGRHIQGARGAHSGTRSHGNVAQGHGACPGEGQRAALDIGKARISYRPAQRERSVTDLGQGKHPVLVIGNGGSSVGNGYALIYNGAVVRAGAHRKRTGAPHRAHLGVGGAVQGGNFNISQHPHESEPGGIVPGSKRDGTLGHGRIQIQARAIAVRGVCNDRSGEA